MTCIDMDETKNFFKGQYTRHDYFSVLKGFENGTESNEFYDQLEKQWDEIDTSATSGFNEKQTWLSVNHQLFNQGASSRTIFKIYQIVRNIAAILFIPLLLITGVLYFQQSFKTDSNAWAEINCPSGVRTEFKLPDGSTGFLNSKSKLRYPVQFDKIRNVFLEGEAYFDVVKQNGNKFRVNTPSLKVEVLGTSFNVSAYSDSREEIITLQTGKVNVLDKNDKILSGLNPNQQFTLNKSQNKFSEKDVNALNYTSWITGKIIIQDEAFEDVAKRLSRWYDVEIDVEGQKLKDFKYYATFEDEPLDEVLRLIRLTAPIKYQEELRVRNQDGTFSKRKIKFKFDENRINSFK